MIELSTGRTNETADAENFIAKLDSAKDLTRFVELALINRDQYPSKADCLATITVGTFQFAARKITRDRFSLDLAKKTVLSSLYKMEHGHFVIDFQNLLAVDRLGVDYFPTARRLMWEHRHRLGREAEKLIQQQPTAPAKLKRHWMFLANLPLLNGLHEYEIHSQNILKNAENL